MTNQSSTRQAVGVKKKKKKDKPFFVRVFPFFVLKKTLVLVVFSKRYFLNKKSIINKIQII